MMMKIKTSILSFILLVTFLPTSSFSQSLLPTPRNIQTTYTKGTRSVSGAPGKNYWQNTADYILNINYDPATRLLTGVVDIIYTNNSPDHLRNILFKLYPNYYKIGSPRDYVVDPSDIGPGVNIDSIWVNQAIVPKSGLRVNGTNANLGGISLPSKGKAHFRMAYHYTVNKGSHSRTGEIEPGAAFIAYFFPRIAVYDDIDGWNEYPYLGSKEFYNDFCNFRASITVPANFVVWATGDYTNISQILSPVYLNRFRQAETSEKIINIIDTSDLRKKDFTVGGGPHTWQFDARNVTDFAFALSDHYAWQSSSVVVESAPLRRTRVDAAFNPSHLDYFHVAEDARKTVEFMSTRFPAWPFPYPHVTVFDGLDQMEYPMMVNDNPVADRTESITLTTHEVFHMMFPFYVGTNETKYAWMDEGWATIGEWLISAMIDTTIVDTYGIAPTAANAGRETDLPIITLSTEQSRSYFTNTYPEPALAILYLKDLLGEQLFRKAVHHYIKLWAGKHPMPNDFFYAINAGAGKNLNWFWKKWFFETGEPDLAISSAKKSGTKLNVTIAAKGSKPVPVDLEVVYTDGTSTKIHRNVGVWEKRNSSILITLSTSKNVKTLVLGHPHTPDSNPHDNVWSVIK